MRNNKHSKGNPQLRTMLTREAARLMYEEDIKQYHDAKRIAAKRLFGRGKKSTVQVRTQDLPTNGEIADEVATLARFHEGNNVDERLFAMRVTALDIMLDLKPFSPRLIGSVSTGRVRKGSDIDLHVFVDDQEQLDTHIKDLGWDYEESNITIQKDGKLIDFTHIYINRQFPIELSIYPQKELRIRGKSSTDGKPIIRLNYDALLQKIIDDHGITWSEYLAKNNPISN
mgnify:CR=1 FL=1